MQGDSAEVGRYQVLTTTHDLHDAESESFSTAGSVDVDGCVAVAAEGEAPIAYSCRLS